MGLFDLNNLGSAGTQHVVATFFDEAEAEVESATTASPPVEEPVVAKDKSILGAKDAGEVKFTTTAPPAVKEPSVAKKEEAISEAKEFKSTTVPPVIESNTPNNTHGKEDNAAITENETRVTSNIELAEPDGVCHGIMKDGSSRDCNKNPMIGKRVCWSHRAQDGQV